MRDHGIANFPDPDASGGLRIDPSMGIDPQSPQFQAAYDACQSLAPKKGGSAAEPTITSDDQAAYLAAAECMRSHGFPGFPDPEFANGGVNFPIPQSIDQNSTQFANAVTACQKLIPAGLPYSGTD